MRQNKLVNIFKTTGPNIIIRFLWIFWEVPVTKKGNMIKRGAKNGPDPIYILILYSPLLFATVH